MPRTADTLALRGAIALAATAPDAVLLAALLDWPLPRVHEALARSAAAADPAADPLAAVARWLQSDPAPAAAAIARAIAWHLQQGRPEAAARIVLGAGSPAQAAQLLAEAGWTLMYRPGRALAGALLERVALLPAAAPALRMLQYAWRIEVERLPHVVERALRAETGLDAARLALLRSRMAQMYDQPTEALALAEQAAAAFEAEDLQPESLLARYALGFARLESARPRDALEPLQRLVRACDRDGLPLLALDALHVLARVHDELGDRAAVRRTLALARPLATGAPADLPALQGLERLRRSLVQRLAGAADDDTGGPVAAREPDTAYGAFPHLVLDALDALAGDRLDAAAATLAELDRRVAAAFHCRKWRLEQAHAASWLAARRGDRDALGSALAATPPAEAALFDLHEAVLAAAAAALAGRPVDAAALAALDARLAAAGLGRLRRRLALVRALDPDADPAALLDWLRAAAADGERDDALWLAPKLAARLDALLAAPRAANHDAERALARTLLDRMLEPLARIGDATAGGTPPPADLTAREWQILQLIGARLTNEQIAVRLHVSVATVKTHINRVYAKLGIGSRSEAVQRARDLV